MGGKAGSVSRNRPAFSVIRVTHVWPKFLSLTFNGEDYLMPWPRSFKFSRSVIDS